MSEATSKRWWPQSIRDRSSISGDILSIHFSNFSSLGKHLIFQKKFNDKKVSISHGNSEIVGSSKLIEQKDEWIIRRKTIAAESEWNCDSEIGLLKLNDRRAIWHSNAMMRIRVILCQTGKTHKPNRRYEHTDESQTIAQRTWVVKKWQLHKYLSQWIDLRQQFVLVNEGKRRKTPWIGTNSTEISVLIDEQWIPLRRYSYRAPAPMPISR